MTRWLSMASALLTLTMVLAACGGDDDSTTTPSAPTKVEFIQQVCAIQAAGNAKLEAAGQAFQHGTSEKQFVDALRVYEVQHGRLDEAYLDRWAATLGVAAALGRLRAEAQPIE